MSISKTLVANLLDWLLVARDGKLYTNAIGHAMSSTATICQFFPN